MCFTTTNQKLKHYTSLSQLWNLTKGSQKEISSDDIKDELLNSLKSIQKTYETELNNVVRNGKNPEEAK